MTEVFPLESYTGKYLLPFGRVVRMTETEICTVVDADNIHDIWKGYNDFNNFESDYPLQVRNLRQDIKSINPEGNPFLVIYKIQ